MATLTGDNGLLQKATTAKEENEQARKLELIKLAVTSAKLAGEGTINEKVLNDELIANLGGTEIANKVGENWYYKGYIIEENSNVEKLLLPKEYQQVEYIESSGTQYIDTGITPKNGFGFWIDVMPLTEISTNVKSSKVFGTSKRNGGMWGGVELATYPSWGPGGQLSWFKPNTLYDPGFQAYTRCQMSDINNIFESSTGKNFATQFYTDSEISGNLYLFAIHQEDGPFTNGAGIRLYGCSLYNQEVVARNYISCYRISDNVIGLYDTVEGKFYTNQGTGTFGYGMEDGTYVAPTNN